MSQGHARRANGSGRRPGDTTIRVSHELMADLRKLHDRDTWFSTMSLASMLQEIVDGFLIRQFIYGTGPSNEVKELRKLAGQMANQEKVHTPSPGGWR